MASLDELKEKLMVGLPVRELGKCWEWVGPRAPQGYGKFTINAASQIASRAAYRVFKGPIKDGYVVMHECDNPPCCNPDHLEAGPQWKNHMDAVARGLRSYKNIKKHYRLDDAFIGLGSASKLTNISTKTISRWCDNGLIPFTKFHAKAPRRISRLVLLKIAEVYNIGFDRLNKIRFALGALDALDRELSSQPQAAG